MSDLQCAATLLLTPAGGGPALGASLVDRRLAAVYTSAAPEAVRTAEAAAATNGIGVSISEDLREHGSESEDEVRARIARELGAIADLHRGETVLVVAHAATLQAGVPPLVGLGEEYGARHPVPPGAVVEVAADADGWALRSWAASD